MHKEKPMRNKQKDKIICKLERTITIKSCRVAPKQRKAPMKLKK